MSSRKTSSSSTKKRLFAGNFEEERNSTSKRSGTPKKDNDSVTDDSNAKSRNLLDTPPSVLPRNVKKSPTGMVIVPETEHSYRHLSSNEKGGGSEVRRLRSILKEREALIDSLKGDLEMAITYSTACSRKLESIYEIVASQEEVSEFNGKLVQKIEDISKVVKKSVKLERVSKFRIINEE